MRRVLVVAHAFAPASPIGTMRTLRLVRRLDAQGWAVTVLTATPGSYLPSMPQDEALLDKVPERVSVVHAPVLRASQMLRPMFKSDRGHTRRTAQSPVSSPAGALSFGRRLYRFADECTRMPDREVGWVAPAVVRGVATILRQRPSVIYSSAPPWSGQLVALILARTSGLPWVADFRDPWARAPWREKQPERVRRAAVALERRVTARADAVLFATRTNRDEYAAYYGPQLAAKFLVVPNGCDPEEFAYLPRVPSSGPFVLVHAGSLYGARRPIPLFHAIASAIEKGLLRRDEFRLRLIGTAIVDEDLQAAAASMGLADIVQFVPRMPRHETLREMASASGLLILQPGTTMSIPGKLYEYLAVARPILALCEEGETADLVRRSGFGLAVSADDVPAIEAALLRVIQLSELPLRPPSRELYDGNRFAADAVAIIATVAERRRPRSQNETDREASAKDAGAAEARR